MFKYLSAAILAILPMGAIAASVASPVIDVPAATGEFVSFVGQGDLLAHDAPAVGQGFPMTGDLLADLDLTFGFFDLLGDDPLAALTDGSGHELSYVVEGNPQQAPIPLPAGGLLLMSRLGLIVIRRAFRRAVHRMALPKRIGFE